MTAYSFILFLPFQSRENHIISFYNSFYVPCGCTKERTALKFQVTATYNSPNFSEHCLIRRNLLSLNVGYRIKLKEVFDIPPTLSSPNKVIAEVVEK